MFQMFIRFLSKTTLDHVRQIMKFYMMCALKYIPQTGYANARYLFCTTLHKWSTKHGWHPITAWDEQWFMGHNGAIIQPEHHICSTGQKTFCSFSNHHYNCISFLYHM